MNQMVGRPAPASDVFCGGIIARFDPRVRIVATVAFAVVVVSLDGWRALVGACVLAVFAAVSARPPWPSILRRLLAMDGLMLLVLASLPFTVPGEPLIHWAGLAASREGLLQALAITAKANAIVLMLSALVGSISIVTLGHAFQRLHVPAALSHLLLFTVRYLDVLGKEYARLRRAMTARAFRGFGPRITHHLSGGEKRLVTLATVLAMQPEVLLLDDPTVGLDDAAEDRLTALLQARAEAMVIVSHDREFRERLATRVVTLRGGRIECDGARPATAPPPKE